MKMYLMLTILFGSLFAFWFFIYQLAKLKEKSELRKRGFITPKELEKMKVITRNSSVIRQYSKNLNKKAHRLPLSSMR